LSSVSPASISTSLSLGMCDATVHRFVIFLSCFYLTLSFLSSMFLRVSHAYFHRCCCTLSLSSTSTVQHLVGWYGCLTLPTSRNTSSIKWVDAAKNTARGMNSSVPRPSLLLDAILIQCCDGDSTLLAGNVVGPWATEDSVPYSKQCEVEPLDENGFRRIRLRPFCLLFLCFGLRLILFLLLGRWTFDQSYPCILSWFLRWASTTCFRGMWLCWVLSIKGDPLNWFLSFIFTKADAGYKGKIKNRRFNSNPTQTNTTI
jgi:hypothetical protein